MNNFVSQFELIEANLQNLKARMPDLPASSILLCRLLLHVGREMAVMFEQQIRPFGLAEAEFRVLTTLFSQPNGVAHPSDLCVRASQSPANMSRISDALVSRGLITRVSSLHDRRRMVLRITEEGETFVRQLLPKLFAPLREMLKDFPETEQQQMTSLLKRLGVELDKATAPQIVEQAL
ncbi:MAG: MarR family transcriptional regulator, negative regulator of the multidrug operon emrRAB [Gammaproteobacteria bacterium]|jgi:MarR family transcriptional repressor of emrRAB|nr:MarR family transcriptional regulator, negative regulator of the multidrug operon emrRAB [Gammaproteobacteria bacterium]